MEIRTYLGIIGRYWWVIVVMVIAAMGTVAVLDSIKTPIYTAHARVLVQPAKNLTDERTLADVIGQLDNLSIANTLAQTFTSAQVKANTLKALNISNSQIQNYTLIANRLPDTIVIEVSGTGPDPNFLASYINATAASAIAESRIPFGVVELSLLDPAGVPRQPSSPLPARDIPTSGALGLLIGILLVLLIDYLRGTTFPVVKIRRARIPNMPNTAGVADTGASSPGLELTKDLTRPKEVRDGPTLVSKDNQKPATDASWLPAPRQRRPHAKRNRG